MFHVIVHGKEYGRAWPRNYWLYSANIPPCTALGVEFESIERYTCALLFDLYNDKSILNEKERRFDELLSKLQLIRPCLALKLFL